MEYIYSNRNIKRMEQLQVQQANYGVTKERTYLECSSSHDAFDALYDRLEQLDIVYLSSIRDLAIDHQVMLERLYRLRDKNIVLTTFHHSIIDIDLLLEFYEFSETSRKVYMKKQQHKGIQKALKKKDDGVGRYGRPCVEMPEHFEENVRQIILCKGKTHVEYMKQCGIKRATYYKLVRRIRQHWIEQELSNIKKA